MKVIAFFSRLAIICNIAFLLFVFMGISEAVRPAIQNRNIVTSLPFVNDLIIILGLGSIFLNCILSIVYAVAVIIGRKHLVPKWMAIVNISFLLIQVLYYFFW
jgi:hypothetical protein